MPSDDLIRMVPRLSGRTWQGAMVRPGAPSSSIFCSSSSFCVSIVAGRMWNWMSGPARSGRDLQNTAMCAAESVSRPLRWNRYFSVSPTKRVPLVSSLTETVPAFRRKVEVIT